MNHAINSLLTALNNVGEAFCEHAVGVFLQSALLVIVLYAVDLLLRKRVRAVFRYCVWLLVLVKLVLPPGLSLPTGVGYWAGDHLPSALSVSGRPFDGPGLEYMGMSGEMPHAEPSDGPAESNPLVAVTNAPLLALTWQAILFILWLVGVLAFLALLVQRARFVRALIAASNPAKEEFAELLAECRRLIGVCSNTRLRISEAIPSPAVCGFFRPTILIPAALVDKLSSEGLRAILIHELAHIKRGDLWVNSIQTFLQIVYFYNPFVWLANSTIRRVCEEAVDETVLVTLGGRAKDYSNTLIDIGEMTFWRADLGLRLVGVAESRKALQWRIRHMLTRPIPKSSKLGALGTTVLLTLAAILLPMAKGTEPATDASEKVEDSVAVSSKDTEPKPATKDRAQATATLFQAIRRHAGIELITSALADGADVNSRNSDGQTALHYALDILHGRRLNDATRAMVEFGANLNARDNKGQTPLHLVGKNHKGQIALFHEVKMELTGLLILNGADVNARDNEGRTPVMNAFARTDIGAFELLIANGADVPEDLSAAYNGDFARIQTLIKNGKTREGFGQGITLLHAAVAGGHEEIVELLLAVGVDILAKTERGCTALNYAIAAHQKEMVELLIAKGVDVNSGGLTPLAHAVCNQRMDARRLEMVELLLAKGANPNADGEPLCWAVWMWTPIIAHALVVHGGDIHKDSWGYSPLSEAIKEKQAVMIEVLHYGAGEIGTDGRTPLHAAALAGDTQKVEQLIKQGADINAKDDRLGRTPLHYAVHAGHPRVVELLVAAGADVNARSKADEIPLGQASFRGNTRIIELLLTAGADINAKCKWGMTPLSCAAHRGRTEAAKVLLARGADINARADNHGTPLHVASQGGYLEFVKYLLLKGANADAKTNDNKTPLQLAEWNGCVEVVKLLRKHGAK